MSEFPGVETLSEHGHLDFGQRMTEELREVFTGHDRELPDGIAKGLPHDPLVVATRERQPTTAHYRTITLDGVTPTEVTSMYPDRASITVTCQAGGPVRIGADNQIGTGAADPKSVALPTGVGRTMHHTGRVFVHGPANAVVDVIEEHFPPAGA